MSVRLPSYARRARNENGCCQFPEWTQRVTAITHSLQRLTETFRAGDGTGRIMTHPVKRSAGTVTGPPARSPDMATSVSPVGSTDTSQFSSLGLGSGLPLDTL